MALTKQNITMSLLKGINTKTDEKVLNIGELTELVNGVFRKTGTVEKRFGFEKVGKTILTTTSSITDGQKLSQFNNDLILLNNTTLYNYGKTNNAWINKGSFSTVTVDAVQIVRNSATQVLPDIAFNNGICLVAWEDSRSSGVRYSLVDNETNSALISDQALAASTTKPRCVSIGKYLLLLYVDGTTIKYIRYDTLTLASAAGTLASDLNATFKFFDVAAWDDKSVVFGYNQVAAFKIGYLVIESRSTNNPAIGTSASDGVYDANTTYTEIAQTALSIATSPSENKIYVSMFSNITTVDKVFLRTYANTLYAASSASATLESLSSVINLSTIVDSAGTLQVFYEVTAASVKNHTVRKTTATWLVGSTITAGTPSVLKRSVGLFTKPFKYNSTVYVNVTHESGLQPTYFTVDSSGNIATKVSQGVGGGLSKNVAGTQIGQLGGVSYDAVGRPVFAVLIRNKLTTESGKILANTGVAKVSLNFESPSFSTSQLGSNLHVAGGFLTNYDGVSVTEHGFHLYPEDLSTNVTAGVGLTSSIGMQWRALYEWSDAQGQLHRSTPSVATSTTTFANKAPTVTVPTLRLTAKTTPRAEVKIVLFRTKDGGITFYRAGETDNVPGSDTVTFTDTMADATLITKEILYTTGGIIENIAPPSCKIVHKHTNRIFLAGLEDSNTVWFSKKSVFSSGVEFSDLFLIRVTPSGGDITALGTLDDKLVIFKQDSIFILAGDGPLETGQQDTFTEPQQIASDVGCSNIESLVLIPGGLLFKSEKGLKLLDRSLNIVDVGAPVKDFNSLEITSAILIKEEDEVRFTTRTGQCLVFNYYYNQWSTFSNYEAQSAILWQGDYYHLKSNGDVNKETSAFSDNGSSVGMRVSTGWISLSGIEGYQRVYSVTLLGKNVSNHVLKTDCYYDYEPAIRETIFFNTSSSLDQSYLGEETYVGISDILGSEKDSTYHFEIRPKIQKCTSIKFTFEDLTSINDIGGGYQLTALTLEAGMKKGANKFSKEQKVGG